MLSLIAAIDRSRGLGKDNKLLFRIPADLKRFKKITSDHPVIMGRKTFEEIGRPLPNRTNIVVTRNKDYKPPGCTVVHSLDEAISHAQSIDNKEIFIIGGGQIYTQAIKHADRLYLTIIDAEKEADTYFPDYSQFSKVVQKESCQHNNLHYTFLQLEKPDIVKS